MTLAVLLTMALAAQEPAAAPASIRMSGLRAVCLSNDTHPRVDVTIAPALSVADASLQFRSAKAKGWYGISLRQQEGNLFSAHLPRPKWLKEFEYFVRATDPEGREVKSDIRRATVAGRAAACEVAGQKVVVKDLIVRRPDGADGEDDGLPPGFSRRGTAGDIGMFELSGRTVAGLTALTVGGIAATATVLAQGENPSNPIPDRPAIEYNVILVNAIPVQGSTLRVGDTATLAFEVRTQTSSDYVGPRAQALRVELYTAGKSTPCLSTIYRPGGQFSNATVAIVSTEVRPSAGCSVPFAIERATVTFLNADLSPFPAVRAHDFAVRYSITP